MKKTDKFRFIISICAIVVSIVNIIILYNVHIQLQDIKSSIDIKHGSIEVKKNYSESNDLLDVTFNQVD